MAPRALWKGYLKLSLVSCAISLFTATTASSRVRFNMLNRATGNRLKQQYVDAVTGEPVEAEDRTRGFEVAKNEYVMIENDEIDAVEIESTHTLTVDKFVPRNEVDQLYLDQSYYIAPDDRVSLEAFSVVREAMKSTQTAGIGRVVLHRREHMMLLEPRGKGILATTLHYGYEVRSEDAVFEDIEPVELDKETLELATRIVESKRGKFDPNEFDDRYENALIALIRSKQAGERPQPAAQAAPPSNVVSLMEALRRSVASEAADKRSDAEGGDKARSPAARPKAARKAATPRHGRAKKRLRKAG